MKRKCLLLLAIVATLVMSFTACAPKENRPEPTPEPTPPTIATFEVAASMKVDFGAEVTVPVVTATDSEGNALTVSRSVADKNGTAVELTDGKFTAAIEGDGAYTISYTVTLNGTDTTKTTTVNVGAKQIDPPPVEQGTVFEVPALEDIYTEDVYLIKRMYAVTKDGDKVYATYTVSKGGQPITVENDSFVPEVGTYTVVYTVTHPSLPDGQQSKTLTLRVTPKPDMVAPAIVLPESALLESATFGYKAIVDAIEVTDNRDENPQVEVTLTRNGEEIASPTDSIAAKAGDVFVVSVTATDAADNAATAQATFAYLTQDLLNDATDLYDFAALDVADFTATAGTPSIDTEHVVTEKALRLDFDRTASLAFDKLAVKFIDDHEAVELVVYATEATDVTFYGRGKEVRKLNKGMNVVRVERADFGQTLYDRAADDGEYVPNRDWQTQGYNVFYNTTANVAALDGNFRLAFKAKSAASVYVAGLFALRGDLVRTDLIDMSVDTAMTTHLDSTDDKTVATYYDCSLVRSSVFDGYAFSFTNKVFEKNDKPCYFYIKNDRTNTNPKVPLNTLDYVTLVFTYDGPVLKTNGTAQPFIRMRMHNYYVYVRPGINVVTIPRQYFASGIISEGGVYMGDTKYYFYFYLNMREYAKAGGTENFTITLDAIYGLSHSA